MKFFPAISTVDYHSRYVSKGGLWELGFKPMLFGVRVVLGRVGGDFYTLNYCCGTDSALLIKVFAAVMIVLEGIPEDASSETVRKTFPRNLIKPIDRDPAWAQLQELAWGKINMPKEEVAS